MKGNIVFIDSTYNYPHNFTAANTKIDLLAQGLNQFEDDCIIINSILGDPKIKKASILYNNTVKYAIFPSKKKSIFNNILFLYKLLKSRKNDQTQNIAIITSPYFPLFILDIIILKILKYKVFAILHEWHISINSLKGIKKLNAYIYDYTFGYFVDGFFPISDFLKNKIIRYNKPIFKLPIVADYQALWFTVDSQYNNYFLYCGNAGYKRVIDKLIIAFAQIPDKYNSKLILVLSGNEIECAAIDKMLKDKKLKDKIITLTKIPYNDLLTLYRGAIGLLIPLSPKNIQDQARFSQKIAEYLSTKRPIITTNVGEIKNFFKDRENALITQTDNSKEYYEKMLWLLEHRKEGDVIGEKGYTTGIQNFNYKNVCKNMNSFIKNHTYGH